MSAVAPASDVTPPPSGGATEAWARKISINQPFLRVVEVIGAMLGHGPGTLRTKDGETVFSYKSLRTFYSVALIVLVTCAQIYSLVTPTNSFESFDTATNVAAVTPHYMDALFFYFIAVFNLCRSRNIKTSFSGIYKLSKSTVSPSLLKQFLILLLWIFYVVIAIGRGIVLTIQFLSVQKVDFHFGAFIVPFVNVFIKIYLSWLLEIYILICMNFRERQQQLRKLMKEVITPHREDLWNLLDVQVIEGAINEHRSFSRQASRFFETMSPALFLLLVSFFVNEALGLHALLRNVVFVNGVLKPMALIEISFLLFHFLLIFAVCYITSSLSDQWCGVGQEVTGVPFCRVTSQIRVQLLTFLQQLPDQTPVITGAGFFVISKSLILTMMNFVAVYLIFIVQFFDA